MNDGENSNVAKFRIALITTSSLLVSLPQLMWAFLGYRGLPTILLESFFIVLGFLFLVLGLSDPLALRFTKMAEKIWPENNPESFLTKHRKKLLLLQFVLVLYLIVPYTIASIMGYTLPTTYILLFYVLSTFLCISLIVYFYRKNYFETGHRQWPLLATLALLSLVWTFAFWYGSPRFPTDEFAIDLYSAHLFLNGLNPYLPQNTVNVFAYFQLGGSKGLPVNVITPYSTGGFVTNLSYPAISVLAFVPSVLIGRLQTATMIPLYAIPPLIAYLAYHRRKLGEMALIPVFIILLNPSYLGQVGLGYSDIIWMVMTMLSLYFYRKPVVSGLLMGAALSVKQIPWLLFPFMFIFLFKELGFRHSTRWAVMSVVGFLAINLVFFVQDPAAFFKAIVAPEFQQIIGVGFGPSQLSFLGIIPVPRMYFSLMTVSILIASILVYSIYYEKLRYSFLAFPIIIFLFNYRLLLNYILFWPLISLLMPAMIMERKRRKSENNVPAKHAGSHRLKRLAIPALIIVLLVAPAAYAISAPSDTHQISITGLHSSQISSENVTGMSLFIRLNYGGVSYGELLYRIAPASHSLDMNGYLWRSENITELSNGSRIVHIVPESQSQNLPWNGSYRLIVYYGNISSTTTFSLNSGNLTPT